MRTVLRNCFKNFNCAIIVIAFDNNSLTNDSLYLNCNYKFYDTALSILRRI